MTLFWSESVIFSQGPRNGYEGVVYYYFANDLQLMAAKITTFLFYMGNLWKSLTVFILKTSQEIAVVCVCIVDIYSSFKSGVSRSAPNWVRLVPIETNLGLFKISFSTFCLLNFLKKSQICPI